MISPVQAAVGIIVTLVAVGALLYTFYSRTDGVQKTGYGALLMLSIVSLRKLARLKVGTRMVTRGETSSGTPGGIAINRRGCAER